MAEPRRWDTIDLSEFLAGVGGAVTQARQLSGGASKDTWLFDVELAGGETRPYILRRASQYLSHGALDVPAEYAVMRAAFEAGVRLPEPYYLGTDAEGAPFIVLEYVDGETLAPRILRDDAYAAARERMAAQLGELVAPVHRIEPSAAVQDVLGPVPDGHPGERGLVLYDAAFREAAKDPHPVFELAFRQLTQTLPAECEMTVVHGDYRLGNIIVGSDGIRAILDWELCHFGDPMEDLAWTVVRAWRFGHDDRPVAGCGEREALWAGYEKAGGKAVDPERARWWEIFSNLKWGIITLMQGARYYDGEPRDLEKGAIGRRAAEVEAELLNLLDA